LAGIETKEGADLFHTERRIEVVLTVRSFGLLRMPQDDNRKERERLKKENAFGWLRMTAGRKNESRIFDWSGRLGRGGAAPVQLRA
jgi:hypothetical protein